MYQYSGDLGFHHREERRTRDPDLGRREIDASVAGLPGILLTTVLTVITHFAIGANGSVIYERSAEMSG